MSRSLAKWDQRLERAVRLAATYPAAAEALRFYEHLASFQKSLYARLETGRGAEKTLSWRDGPELAVLLPGFAPFLSLVESIAPASLAQSAAELKAMGEMRWGEILEESWRDGVLGSATLTAAETLLARAFLQPYAEHLADHSEPPELRETTPALCPRCSGRPQVGALRPQGDGARRSLICSLCATEWDYRRLVCPACGEEDVDKLPVYTAEGLDHIRVEACDTCRCYIKTVDLTKNGRAVPVVDELAAIPLSLWAEENGYTKVSPNLLGL